MNQFESMTAKYFKLWQTKNIEGLSKLFDDSILLQDWDNLIRGKEAIIKFNIDFFNSVNLIELNVVSSHCFENTTFSRLCPSSPSTQLARGIRLGVGCSLKWCCSMCRPWVEFRPGGYRILIG